MHGRKRWTGARRQATITRVKPKRLLISSLVLVAGSVRLIWTSDVAVGIAGVVFFGLGVVLAARRLLRPQRAVVPEDYPVTWFSFDPDLVLTEFETAFLDKLTRRARAWPAAGTDSYAMRDEDDSDLVLSVSLCPDGVGILGVGVHLNGDMVRGDKLHHALYDLAEPPTTLAMSATGRLDELVDRVSEWFETILHRPVERLEWWHDGAPYAVRYQLADTAEGLSEAYVKEWAPPGQHDRLIAEGSFRGRHWIRTAGIGTPDRTVPVRADGEAISAPRLPRFLFYECPLERL